MMVAPPTVNEITLGSPTMILEGSKSSGFTQISFGAGGAFELEDWWRCCFFMIVGLVGFQKFRFKLIGENGLGLCLWTSIFLKFFDV